MNNRLPRYKRNFRVNFFLSDKKYMAVEAVEWSKWIISVGSVADNRSTAVEFLGGRGGRLTRSVGISSLFLMYTAREGIFGFGKNKFA